ncbi:MAG: efflux transporter outer membrane subunit, partial [Comamonadaceae bacterium]
WRAPLPPAPAHAAPAAAAGPAVDPSLPHGGTPAGLARWWESAGDPLLVELVDAADAASPTLAQAASRIGQARAQRVTTGAALGPTLDATANISRGFQPQFFAVATSGQGNLQASWEPDVFGGNRAARDAAQARLEGAQAGWHAARVSLAAETANSYVGLRTCEQQVVVATNDARSRSETARLADLSTQAGFTAPASSALARASAAEASARATQQRAQCDIEIKALVALTALAEPDLRQKLAAAPGPQAQDAMFSIATVPAEVLAQRPDVLEAERDVAAASADLGAARADRFPRLTLSGSIAAGRVRSGGTTTDLDTWSIGPLSLTVPIFDGGRRAANVDAAQARYEEAAALYQARVRQAVREVEEALVSIESARARNEDARVATEGYRASFTATEARYRSGLASLVELEDARRTALAAETALVALQRERLAAWIALYRATGGGWTRSEATAAAQPMRQP